MCKLKPLLQRWLQDAQEESSLAACKPSQLRLSYLQDGFESAAFLDKPINMSNLKNDYSAISPNGLGFRGSSSIGACSSLFSVDCSSRRRKKRTSIETTVRLALEKAFLSNPKPTSEDIALLADKLYMEKEVVSSTKKIIKFAFTL